MTTRAFDIFRIPVILYAYLRMRGLNRYLNTRSRLLGWQERQILRHLRFIYRRSPYFRARLTGPDLAAWTALPILTKSEWMENFSTINTRAIDREHALSVAIDAERTRDFAPTIDGVTIGLSSGTSGHRGIFIVSRLEQWLYAGTILAKILPGFWRRRQRVALFLRANNNLYASVRSRALRFEYFDLLVPVTVQLPRLQDLNPTLLIAPPSLLRELAQLKREGKILLQPDKIISVAEVLDPIDKEFIAGVFAQTVHQIYQATEGFLAVTCAHGILHLNEDLLHVEKEWLDYEGGKFQPVITDFSRKTQPIVRYRLNDILTTRVSPCPCGSPLTALEFIEGRSDDLFRLDARYGQEAVVIYPDFIRRAMLFASDQIADYRVNQTAGTVLRIQYVLRAGASGVNVEESVRREFNELAGKLGAVITALELVREPSFASPSDGKKLRRIINSVDRPTSV